MDPAVIHVTGRALCLGGSAAWAPDGTLAVATRHAVHVLSPGRAAGPHAPRYPHFERATVQVRDLGPAPAAEALGALASDAPLAALLPEQIRAAAWSDCGAAPDGGCLLVIVRTSGAATVVWPGGRLAPAELPTKSVRSAAWHGRTRLVLGTADGEVVACTVVLRGDFSVEVVAAVRIDAPPASVPLCGGLVDAVTRLVWVDDATVAAALSSGRVAILRINAGAAAVVGVHLDPTLERVADLAVLPGNAVAAARGRFVHVIRPVGNSVAVEAAPAGSLPLSCLAANERTGELVALGGDGFTQIFKLSTADGSPCSVESTQIASDGLLAHLSAPPGAVLRFSGCAVSPHGLYWALHAHVDQTAVHEHKTERTMASVLFLVPAVAPADISDALLRDIRPGGALADVLPYAEAGGSAFLDKLVDMSVPSAPSLGPPPFLGLFIEPDAALAELRTAVFDAPDVRRLRLALAIRTALTDPADPAARCDELRAALRLRATWAQLEAWRLTRSVRESSVGTLRVLCAHALAEDAFADVVGPLLQSIPAKDAPEECDCNAPIPYENPRRSRCASGHEHVRCGLTLQSVTGLERQRCTFCGTTFALDLFRGDAGLVGWWLQQLAGCLYCGGRLKVSP